MRHCATCGAPISAHTYQPIGMAATAAINRLAPHPAIARARVRGASRVCPIADVTIRDEQGREHVVARVVRESEQPEMRLAA